MMKSESFDVSANPVDVEKRLNIFSHFITQLVVSWRFMAGGYNRKRRKYLHKTSWAFVKAKKFLKKSHSSEN